jgi:hypothetical protein
MWPALVLSYACSNSRLGMGLGCAPPDAVANCALGPEQPAMEVNLDQPAVVVAV